MEDRTCINSNSELETRITALVEPKAVIQFYLRRGRSPVIKLICQLSRVPSSSSSDSSH